MIKFTHPDFTHKINKNQMNITQEQPENYMSLYDFLGKPAGGELGQQVCNEATRKKVPMVQREISNPKYTGKVMTYPEVFLKEYFNK